jgi:hypothetical protein
MVDPLLPRRWRRPCIVLLATALVGVLGCDSRDFQRAKERNSSAAFEEYLQKRPKGKHREEALVRLDELAFVKAQEHNDAAAYQKYLEDYPEGKFRAQARDRSDDLAYQEAEREGTIAAYQAYLLSYQGSKGRHVSQAEEKLKDLRAEEVLDSVTVESVEQYLTDFPESRREAEVVKHLLTLLQDRFRAAGPAERKELRDKIYRHSKNVFLAVQVSSWYEGSQGEEGYFSDLRDALIRAGFEVSDREDQAQLKVVVLIKETRGSTYYFDENKKARPKATNVTFSFSLTHLLLKEDILRKTASYRQPSFISIWVDGDEGPDEFQQAVYKDAIEDLKHVPHYYFFGPLVALARGDRSKCNELYSLDFAYGEQTFIYNNIKQLAGLIKEFSCIPETREEKAVWAFLASEEKTCLDQGRTCANVLCEHMYLYAPRNINWLTALGNEGVTCLCQEIKNNFSQQYYDHFSALLAALEKVSGTEAEFCLKNLLETNRAAVEEGTGAENFQKRRFAQVQETLIKMERHLSGN